jgi:hypothetical protein
MHSTTLPLTLNSHNLPPSDNSCSTASLIRSVQTTLSQLVTITRTFIRLVAILSLEGDPGKGNCDTIIINPQHKAGYLLSKSLLRCPYLDW